MPWSQAWAGASDVRRAPDGHGGGRREIGGRGGGCGRPAGPWRADGSASMPSVHSMASVQTRLRADREARSGGGGAEGRRRGARRRVGAGDRWALGLVGVLPLLAFVVPALVGHPVLLGDDLTQSEPLRVLVGADLRAGHLPLFDPYLWSGAPLLGGWNAGAADPLTWLFAVLPATAAWTAGLVVTWWVAAGSLYGYLRSSRLGPFASGCGALAFAWSGAFLAQVVHFGFVAGMSVVPLQLLAVDRLVTPRGPRLRWAVVLAAALGVTVVAGEPRAIDDAAVVLACYTAWRLVGAGGRRGAALGWVAGAALVGVALGAVQWLPGLEAVGGSQRSAPSVALFASGSLPDRWLGLLLVPDLLGGSGSLRQPAFLPSYSLTEVAGYVGALPLVGGLALLGRLRRRRPVPAWLVWEVVAVVGVVLALGINTPLGHLLAHVPFYGAQRLQSRNVIVADLALAVLTAYVVDDLGRRRQAAGHDGGGQAGDGRVRWLAAVGGLVVASPVVLLGTWGNGFVAALGVRAAPGTAGRLVPAAVPFAVCGVLAAAAFWEAPRRPSRVVRRGLAVLQGANLAAFALLVVVAVPPAALPPPSVAPPPSSPSSGRPGRAATAGGAAGAAAAATSPPPGPARPVGALGLGGRFAIYDPGLLDAAELTVVGTPDGNVVTGTPSVLGYGSIVGARYAAATGTHLATGAGQDVLSPAAVTDGVLDQLGTRVLLTPPAYLVTPAGGGGPAPGVGTGTRRLGAGAVTWPLGEPLALRWVQLARRGGPDGAVRIGLVGVDGRTRWWPAANRRGTVTVGLARPFVAVAVRATGPPGVRLGPAQVRTVGGRLLVADGQLEAALAPPHWRYRGRDGGFAVFVDRRAAPMLALEAPPGGALGNGHLGAAAGPPGAPDAVPVWSPAGAVVVRAVSALPGWHATWQADGSGPAVPVGVRRRGLVQAVTVPPGGGVLRFVYDPPGFATGAALSLAALALMAVAGAGGACARLGRRARGAGGRRGTPGGGRRAAGGAPAG